MATQLQNPRHFKPPLHKHPVFITIAVLMIVLGAIICILNIVGTIEGPWTSILGVISSALGIMLTLLSLDPATSVSIESANLDADKLQGVLIVKVDKKYHGNTVNLSRGFNTMNLKPDLASNVIKCKVDGHKGYAAIFHSLEPNNYTVYLDSREHVGRVTIYAGRTEKIEWR